MRDKEIHDIQNKIKMRERMAIHDENEDINADDNGDGEDEEFYENYQNEAQNKNVTIVRIFIF